MEPVSTLRRVLYISKQSYKKNVPWHILAPAVVACDIFSIRRSAHPAGGFLYNRKCNFLLYKNVLVRYRTRTTYIVVPPYFTDSLRLPASLSRIHSLSTLTGASRHSLLVPASEYISLTFFLIVRLLILHGSGFRCAALGCIRSLFLRAPLTCRLLSVRVYPPLLLPFIAFAYWLYFLYPAVMLTDLTCFVKQIV